jgi:hypothetical protein
LAELLDVFDLAKLQQYLIQLFESNAAGHVADHDLVGALDGRLSRLELRARLAERVTVVILSVTLVGLLLTLVHVVRGHNYAVRRVRMLAVQYLYTKVGILHTHNRRRRQLRQRKIEIINRLRFYFLVGENIRFYSDYGDGVLLLETLIITKHAQRHLN